MVTVGVIAGSGAELFPVGGTGKPAKSDTRWGSPSAPLRTWQQSGREVVFLARHGEAGAIPPHRVNYRANVAAMADRRVDWLIALNTVGAIRSDLQAGSLVIPDQLIDYTWGRGHTIFDDDKSEIEFIDFTEPYSTDLRTYLIAAAGPASLQVTDGATYGATQGPRLETTAEIDRLERDGCDIVGMTGMPEAALAREFGLCYASLCIVVNTAAGRGSNPIHSEIGDHLQAGLLAAGSLFAAFLQQL